MDKKKNRKGTEEQRVCCNPIYGILDDSLHLPVHGGASVGVTQYSRKASTVVFSRYFVLVAHLPSAELACFFLSRDGFSSPFTFSTPESNFADPRHCRSPLLSMV